MFFFFNCSCCSPCTKTRSDDRFYRQHLFSSCLFRLNAKPISTGWSRHQGIYHINISIVILYSTRKCTYDGKRIADPPPQREGAGHDCISPKERTTADLGSHPIIPSIFHIPHPGPRSSFRPDFALVQSRKYYKGLSSVSFLLFSRLSSSVYSTTHIMVSQLFNKFKAKPEQAEHAEQTTSVPTSGSASLVEKNAHYDDSKVPYLTWRSCVMGVIASMGGFIFGYSTGLSLSLSVLPYTNVGRTNFRLRDHVRLPNALRSTQRLRLLL